MRNESMQRTYCGYTLSRARFACINLHKMYLAALLISVPPVYSGKYRSSGTCDEALIRITTQIKWNQTFGSFFLKTSILFRNNMMDVRRNQRELITDSNRMSDSCIRFYRDQFGGHSEYILCAYTYL